MLSFKMFCEQMEEKPDKDTCVVDSIAAVTGKTPEQVRTFAQEYLSGNGTIQTVFLNHVLKKMGYTTKIRYDLMVKAISDTKGAPRNMGTNWNMVQKKLAESKDRKYIVLFTDHVVAFVNGKAKDVGCTGKKKRVKEVWEVTKF